MKEGQSVGVPVTGGFSDTESEFRSGSEASGVILVA